MAAKERSTSAVQASSHPHDGSSIDDVPEEVLPPSATRPPPVDNCAASPKGAAKGAASTGMPPITPPGGSWRELPPPTTLQVAGGLINWGTWAFIAFLVVAQFCGIFWDSVDTRVRVEYGRRPSLGPSAVAGDNDAAFTDRALACVLEGRFYRPVPLSRALDPRSPVATTVVDASGAAVDGYRVSTRRSGLELSEAAAAVYSDACALLAATQEAVAAACTALGYRVRAGGKLRVVANDTPSSLVQLEDSLPVLLLPLWDNAPLARFVLPGADGSACVFRLRGKFLDRDAPRAVMEAVDRAAREAKTREWLGAAAAAAEWENGWLRVPGLGQGAFFSDVISSEPDAELGVARRVFDPERGEELDCAGEGAAACASEPVRGTWGAEFRIETRELAYSSVAALDDAHFGLFQSSSTHRTVVRSAYGWETLISNVCLSFVLGRWLVAMGALLAGYARGKSAWFNGGLGCVSSSRAFNVLPIALLPRLPVTLSAFWTVGCMFEGDQAALSECWFAVYPAVVEVLFIYYSLLNIAAKLARRRMSDALFAPTVAALCAMHRARQQLAESGAIGVDGRVSTLVSSAEAARLSLADFVTSDVAWRINGAVAPLFAAKLALLALNLLPLLAAEYVPPAAQPDTGLRGVEKALAIRASNVGGLGRSAMYLYQPGAGPAPAPGSWLAQLVPCLGAATARASASKRATTETTKRSGSAVPVGETKEPDKAADGKLALNGYELVRLGYVVLGGKFLVTLDAWDTMWTTALLRRVYYLYNHRVVLFPLRDRHNLAEVDGKPRMCRLDDEQLEGVSAWTIAAQPVRC